MICAGFWSLVIVAQIISQSGVFSLIRQERPKRAKRRFFDLFRRRNFDEVASVTSMNSRASGKNSPRPIRRRITSSNSLNHMAPQSETLRGFRTFYGTHQKQYTISSKAKYVSCCRPLSLIFHLFWMRISCALCTYCLLYANASVQEHNSFAFQSLA